MTGETGIHEQIIGDDSVQGAVRALAVVSNELMETIRNAHLALEDCVDGRGGTAALTRTGELWPITRSLGTPVDSAYCRLTRM